MSGCRNLVRWICSAMEKASLRWAITGYCAEYRLSPKKPEDCFLLGQCCTSPLVYTNCWLGQPPCVVCKKHVSLSCWCSWLNHYGWTWVESSHLWVGCICLEYALYILVVTLGMSGPICEWGVSALSVHYVFLLSLSAWVDPSVSGMYLPQVCIICSCCHSWHEWTHLRVGCICLECALYVLVVTLGMSGPIWERGVSALSVR